MEANATSSETKHFELQTRTSTGWVMIAQFASGQLGAAITARDAQKLADLKTHTQRSGLRIVRINVTTTLVAIDGAEVWEGILDSGVSLTLADWFEANPE
jgi:hypothetical protein